MDRVQTLVRADRGLGVRVIAEELHMNRETVRQIVRKDLGMRKFSAKMVPRILTRPETTSASHFI
jgi:orotate phosphoribosyltransferase-like protein